MIYILTGKKTNIKIVFKYDLNGLLRNFEIEGDIVEFQLKYMFWNDSFPFPYKEDLIPAIKKLGSFGIKQVQEDLSFERFWEKYNYKVSRSKAEKLWERLSKAKRIQVFEHLPRYFAFKTGKGQEKAYPDTYLRNDTWEDIYEQ